MFVLMTCRPSLNNGHGLVKTVEAAVFFLSECLSSRYVGQVLLCLLGQIEGNTLEAAMFASRYIGQI